MSLQQEHFFQPMHTTVHRHRHTAAATILVFSLLLTPWGAGAESLSTPMHAPNADATRPNPPDDANAVMSLPDFSHPTERETRLDRVRDRAIEESLSEGHSAATVLSPFRSPLPLKSSSDVVEPTPHQARELTHTLKEAVRPTYEHVVNSGVVEAIRSVMGSKSAPEDEFSASKSGKEREYDSRQLPSGERPADGSRGATGSLSPEQKTTDATNARVLLAALIDEITPWAILAAVLFGLFQLGKSVLAYRKRKADRQRRRRRSGMSRSRSNDPSKEVIGDRSSRSRGSSRRRRSRSAPPNGPDEHIGHDKDSANRLAP